MYVVIVTYSHFPGSTRVYGPFDTRAKAQTVAYKKGHEALYEYPQGIVMVRKIRETKKHKEENDLQDRDQER